MRKDGERRSDTRFVTPEMLLPEVVAKYPATRKVFDKYGLRVAVVRQVRESLLLGLLACTMSLFNNFWTNSTRQPVNLWRAESKSESSWVWSGDGCESTK